MSLMLNPKVRRFLSKKHMGEIILPFALGFSTVVLFFWIRQALTSEGSRNKTPVSTFKDKNGQVYLKRHGMQDESDINRLKNKDHLYFGIRADAGNSFKRVVVNSKTVSSSNNSGKPNEPHIPPGEIWSWPRIEEEADPNKLVWVVTPTYRNPFQYAELTRIAQALYPARKFVRWLVADDHTKSKNFIMHLRDLRRLLLRFHINFTMITSTQRPLKAPVILNPKGVDGRRAAVEYIRQRELKGTVYFADDDNAYDSDIFRQIQDTKTVSIWPTGLLTNWAVSAPVINSEGMVIDFFDSFRSRLFPVDFASFAINCSLLHANKKANIPWIQSYEETRFLQKLGVHESDFLPLAANATEVLTWHTKTLKTYSQKKIDIVLYELANWPLTAQKLVKKYQMLFDVSTWEQPKTRKSKLAKKEEKENEDSQTPTYSVSPILRAISEDLGQPIIQEVKEDEATKSVNSSPSPSKISPNEYLEQPIIQEVKVDEATKSVNSSPSPTNPTQSLAQPTKPTKSDDGVNEGESVSKISSRSNEKTQKVTATFRIAGIRDDNVENIEEDYRMTG